MASLSESDDNGDLSSEWTKLAYSPKGDEEAERAISTDASSSFEGVVADDVDVDEATGVEKTEMEATQRQIGEQVGKLQAMAFIFFLLVFMWVYDKCFKNIEWQKVLKNTDLKKSQSELGPGIAESAFQILGIGWDPVCDTPTPIKKWLTKSSDLSNTYAIDN